MKDKLMLLIVIMRNDIWRFRNRFVELLEEELNEFTRSFYLFYDNNGKRPRRITFVNTYSSS